MSGSSALGRSLRTLQKYHPPSANSAITMTVPMIGPTGEFVEVSSIVGVCLSGGVYGFCSMDVFYLLIATVGIRFAVGLYGLFHKRNQFTCSIAERPMR